MRYTVYFDCCKNDSTEKCLFSVSSIAYIVYSYRITRQQHKICDTNETDNICPFTTGDHTNNEQKITHKFILEIHILICVLNCSGIFEISSAVRHLFLSVSISLSVFLSWFTHFCCVFHPLLLSFILHSETYCIHVYCCSYRPYIVFFCVCVCVVPLFIFHVGPVSM